MENKTGEDVELGIFDNMMTDNLVLQPTTLANNCFEKVGI